MNVEEKISEIKKEKNIDILYEKLLLFAQELYDKEDYISSKFVYEEILNNPLFFKPEEINEQDKDILCMTILNDNIITGSRDKTVQIIDLLELNSKNKILS